LRLYARSRRHETDLSVGGADAVAVTAVHPGLGGTTGANTIGFSRAIGVASPLAIREYYKASIVRYWSGGKWLELTGMD